MPVHNGVTASERFAAIGAGILVVNVRMQTLSDAFRQVQEAAARWMTSVAGPCWRRPQRKGRFTVCGCGYRSRFPHKVAAHQRARKAHT